MSSASGPVRSDVLRSTIDLVDEDGSAAILSGRKRGRQTRTRLADELEALEPGSVIGLNTSGVQFMNYSFADECFGVLMQELYGGSVADRYLVLVLDFESQQDLLEELQVSLEKRKLALICLDSSYETSTAPEATIVGYKHHFGDFVR